MHPCLAPTCHNLCPPAPRYCRYQSSCRYKAVVTPSLQAASLQGGCRYTSLHVTGYVVTDPRYRRNWPSLQIPSLQDPVVTPSLQVTSPVVTDLSSPTQLGSTDYIVKLQDQQQLLDTVVTSRAVVTKPSLPRRYRLHCYRGPSLHIVTPYKPCRYTARRYTLYGRGYVSRSCWIGMGHIGIVLNKLSANNGEMSGHLYCVAKALCLLVAY